ncbi:uncharacterized protein [Nicotiana sylvestris]|uniref:uncharacterized protein n=1 Tax=Nicotiana sylvestris TaxID=4096 RepID=UPI00388CBE58
MDQIQEEGAEQENDSDDNWPDLDKYRNQEITPVNSSRKLALTVNMSKGNSEIRVANEKTSLSEVKSNGTVHASSSKEQRAISMDNQKEAQGKNSISTVDKGQSWAGLLQENKLAAKGMNLNYIPPLMKDGEVVVQLMEEDIVEENEKWNRAVILYVVGNTPSIGAIERFINNQWASVQKPKVLFHNEGYFIVLLSTNQEKERVLMNDPYTINNMLVIMRQWSENFDFNEEVLRTIPLWIKLPNLPLNLWSNQALSKTGSGLGKPIYADAWRFTEQLEEEVAIQKSNSEVEEQWQVVTGRSATKKHTDVIREREVDIGNAFKALVDTAQKIVQMSEAQGVKGMHNKEDRVLIAIIEHSVKQSNADSVLRKSLKNWKWVNNYDEAPGGRIWVAWDSILVDYAIIRHHEQFILGEEMETREFKQFLVDAKTDELKTVGRKYAWTNNHVHNRIDRILVNAEWIQKWPNMEGMSMNPGFSDHCPLRVKFDTSSQVGGKPFKFLNCLVNLKTFEGIVQRGWESGKNRQTMLIVWNKLKKLKGLLKQMNKEEFSGIDSKIQDARERLESIQNQMRCPGQREMQIELERTSKLELEKWLMVEESIMKQKSIIQWLNLGDSNTTYYHACMKNRQARNNISRLTDSNGDIMQSPEEVKA